MSKRRTSATPAPRPADPAPDDRAPRFGTVDALALAGALACIVTGYLSRLALNPDGVSYLDLAAAMQRGDWSRFVQGYWSPLFPLLTGAIGTATGAAGASLVVATHVLNTIAAVAGLLLLWRWGVAVRPARPLFGRLAIAAFLLCSAGLPRIEAVTPDILSLFLAVWLSHELLRHGGRRWILVGALFGLTFLVKTSAWPWLIVAVPLRLWAAPDRPARLRVWWSSAVCALTMCTWIVPMSMSAGHPTLGSTARLNYSWYIDANTSRLPDIDLGVNAAYRDVPTDNGQTVTVATFDDAAHWTYQPWGDPTAWSDKVMSDVGREPTTIELIGYWLRAVGRVFGLWLLPMLLVTVVPAYLLHRRAGIWRELITTQRDAAMVGMLGLIGLLQFIAVHAEPRLIAPYGIMLALGSIWLDTATSAGGAHRVAPRVYQLFAWIGVATALVVASKQLIDGIGSASRLAETAQQLGALKLRLAATQRGVPMVGVIGPAAPIMSAAYLSGVHIAMQIPPRAAAVLDALPVKSQVATLTSIFSGRVNVLWKTNNEGGLQMLIVPTRLAPPTAP